MTIVGVALACAPSNSRFNFQTTTSIHARVFAPAPCASCAFDFTPQNMRGMERREAHLVFVSLPASLATRCNSESVSPHGAPLAAICEPGTVLPGEDGGATQPLIRRAFACLRPLLVQPRTAEPRSWPGRSTPASRAQRVRAVTRRRRILLRFKSALEKRPSRTGHAELKRGSERGDFCPHHEMFREYAARKMRVIARSISTKQSSFRLLESGLDCFAALAMTITGAEVPRSISPCRPRPGGDPYSPSHRLEGDAGVIFSP
jgi:hypothetical protein